MAFIDEYSEIALDLESGWKRRLEFLDVLGYSLFIELVFGFVRFARMLAEFVDERADEIAARRIVDGVNQVLDALCATDLMVKPDE